MYGAHIVDVPRRPVAALEDVIGLSRTTRVIAAAADFRRLVNGRTIWNFSSTAMGGGVADMLQVLVGYTKDLAIDIRWLVITGDSEFFRITKRVHNRIHGQPGDGGALGATEFSHVRDVMSDNAESLAPTSAPETWSCCTTRRRRVWSARWPRVVRTWSGGPISASTARMI